MIHIIRSHATREQMDDMLQALGVYLKLAVDTRRGILAGGGVLHADRESVLLEDGSKREDIWGADWAPQTQQVTHEALINIRPRQDNRSMGILDPAIRERVTRIAQQFLGDV